MSILYNFKNKEVKIKKMKVERKKTVSKILLSLILTSTISLGSWGCGRGKTPVGLTNPTQGLAQPSDVDPVSTPDTGVPADQYSPPVGDENGDGLTELPQTPVDIPDPPPAPQKPVQPGEPIIAKAVSYTNNFSLPIQSQIRATYVYIHLTWQPVINAREYWIYKNTLPAFSEANRNNAYAIVKAGSSLSGFRDGLQPPSFSGGNIWDKIKKAVQSLTNLPGVTYKYKVVAADLEGNPISESSIIQTTPLPAIPAPILQQPQDLNTVKPLFIWKDGSEASVDPRVNAAVYAQNKAKSSGTPMYNLYTNQSSAVDGYFISVYPSFNFSQGLSATSFAYWSSYRSAKNKIIRYGDSRENATSYPGTLPFDISFPLQPGKRYVWTVSAILTDTKDMRTAKAVSKSWGGFGEFTIDPNAQPSSGFNFNYGGLTVGTGAPTNYTTTSYTRYY